MPEIPEKAIREGVAAYQCSRLSGVPIHEADAYVHEVLRAAMPHILEAAAPLIAAQVRREAAEQERHEWRERAENAEERLALARGALLADGYFAADLVGADIAPRIVERLSELRDRAVRAEAAIARVRHALDTWLANAATTDNVTIRNWHELFAEDLQAALNDSQEADSDQP